MVIKLVITAEVVILNFIVMVKVGFIQVACHCCYLNVIIVEKDLKEQHFIIIIVITIIKVIVVITIIKVIIIITIITVIKFMFQQKVVNN